MSAIRIKVFRRAVTAHDELTGGYANIAPGVISHPHPVFPETKGLTS
jgi:hypothetical protein